MNKPTIFQASQLSPAVVNHAVKICFLTVTIVQAVWPGMTQATPSQVAFGAYNSFQVNVDSDGQNIVGDRGNEPTIAINPNNSANIVIGWRKFAVPVTTGPQAGYAHSHDGGSTWNVGELPALSGQARTDPALDVDSSGNFYYQSMAHGGGYGDSTSVFKSSDGGMNWNVPVRQFGGDKNWIAIDRTGNTSDGFIYGTWSAATDPDPKYFVRSIDQGTSYQQPEEIMPVYFGFNRIAIGPEAQVYIAGRSIANHDFGEDENGDAIQSPGIINEAFYFLKSLNAKDPSASPSFTAKTLDMGGYPINSLIISPNPKGAINDVQIATDQSHGQFRGNIYVMASVLPPNWQTDDRMDMHFLRSSDGGETWSLPYKINDDTPNRNSFQWFPMMSVAPNSRIDAVWYDTRNGTGTKPYRFSQLYYSYSWDGGISWSPNQPITPAFDTYLPYCSICAPLVPNEKMGDYTHMVSDATGAHIAYTATYNGDHDVYYLNVFPDCNNNAVSDVLDIQQRRSGDTNSNHLPDSCENISVIGDIDGDKDVDQLDINLVNAAKNKPASGPTDPRDLDHNGVINLLDARKQTLLCTRPRCAV